MQSLLEWTLEAIRAELSDFSWMEEHRYSWVPLVKSVLQKMVRGETLLLLTDSKRAWFEQYILSQVNDTDKNRPLLPIQSMRGAFADLRSINNNSKIALLEDMFEITYPQGYFIWYIGEGGDTYTKIAYRREDSFLWLINEEMAGSFVLSDNDPLLDIKLIQLYKLFDKSIEVGICGQVKLD